MHEPATQSFDLELAVRVYPGISKNPVLPGSKLETFGRCFSSLVEATRSLHAKFHVIYDGCPQDFPDLVRSSVAKTHALEEHFLEGAGNVETFKLQREILKKSDAKLVGLVEDDYFFTRTSILELVDFAKSDNYTGFYTIFNSSDYYQLDLHRYKSKIKFNNGRYWRNASSTTLTFFASPTLLRRFNRVFTSFDYGNYDHTLWLVITKKYLGNFLLCLMFAPTKKKFIRLYKIIKSIPFINYFRSADLWVPLPSLGAHLEEEGFPLDNVFE